jgi:hypothetical protein
MADRLLAVDHLEGGEGLLAGTTFIHSQGQRVAGQRWAGLVGA